MLHDGPDAKLDASEPPEILEAKVEICLSTYPLSQAGQITSSTLLALRTSSSNSHPQSLQTNSNIGIVPSLVPRHINSAGLFVAWLRLQKSIKIKVMGCFVPLDPVGLDEDDLSALGHVHKITGGDDVDHAIDEIIHI